MTEKEQTERRLQLEEVASLLRDGLITDDEAKARRAVILQLQSTEPAPPAYSPHRRSNENIPMADTKSLLAAPPRPMLIPQVSPDQLYLASQAAQQAVDGGYRAEFYRLLSLEIHCKNVAYANSVLFFPLGLIMLGGVLPRVRSPLYIGLSLLCLLLSLTGFLSLFIPALIPYCNYYYPTGYECYTPYYLIGFSMIFTPALSLSLTGMCLGIKANLLERKLLRLNPMWYLTMRNDLPTLANQVDEFDIKYRKFNILKRQTRALMILNCIFFFPLGLINAFLMSSHALNTAVISAFNYIMLVINAASIIVVTVFGLLPLYSFLLPALAFQIALACLVHKLKAVQADLMDTNYARFSAKRAPGFDPLISVWNF